MIWEEERHKQLVKQILKICVEQDMTYEDLEVIAASIRDKVEQHKKDSAKEKIKIGGANDGKYDNACVITQR